MAHYCLTFPALARPRVLGLKSPVRPVQDEVNRAPIFNFVSLHLYHFNSDFRPIKQLATGIFYPIQLGG
jgi:hypothetical protein